MKAAASPALLARGVVNVIGLEPLRDKAGPRWPRIRDGIHARLDAILRQKLGPSDFFAPLDDTSFLVTMPAADHDDAQVVCLRIGHELYSEYLGDCDFGTISLSRATAGDEDSVVLERIPQERVAMLAERAASAQPTHRTSTAAPGSSSASASASQPEPAPQEPALQFAPFWDARKEAITGYVALPAARPPSGNGRVVPDIKSRTASDLTRLFSSMNVLSERLDRGERFLLVFPISFEVLGAPVGRMEIAAACRGLPAELRRYIKFELTDIPGGVPHSRLADLICALRPFAQAVIARTGDGRHGYEAYAGAGLQAIGLDLTQAKASERDTSNEIIRLCTAARRLSLQTYLVGAATVGTLTLAREHGVHFLCGRAIAPDVAEPSSVSRLTWTDVLRAAREHRAA